ncbi:MAG: DEAD/DEAH box helicase, partial [Planctomycetes bacterium]|nr:DEAD/DEAH box helicase [Planctomycetota bacterium]
SVVQFIDDRRLGPGFRFFHEHRIVDDRGKVLGYKNLSTLRENLKPVLLRRTRASVQQQLPPRTNEILRIPPTGEQLLMSNAHLQKVKMIVSKKFLTEMDLLMLQKELLMCRMTADSTYLVDKQKPGFSSKLEALDELIERLFDEEGRKAILFSEWTTMLNLIEPLLKKRKLQFVRLDGSVPQKKRQALVHEFQNDEKCKLFLTTNAGATGLNLQAANTVINVDLPWNPAVLEQRIARAYRMGQKRPVDVYILVTESTLEEKILMTLGAKQDLALAALDAESDTDEVRLESGMEELKRRLEVLLGAGKEGFIDESQRRQSRSDAVVSAEQARSEGDNDQQDVSMSSDNALNSSNDRHRESSNEVDSMSMMRRERMANAGGQLLAGAVALLGELLPSHPGNEASQQLAETLKQGFSDCIEKDDRGQAKLTFTLPDAGILNQFADSLARLLTR